MLGQANSAQRPRDGPPARPGGLKRFRQAWALLRDRSWVVASIAKACRQPGRSLAKSSDRRGASNTNRSRWANPPGRIGSPRSPGGGSRMFDACGRTPPRTLVLGNLRAGAPEGHRRPLGACRQVGLSNGGSRASFVAQPFPSARKKSTISGICWRQDRRIDPASGRSPASPPLSAAGPLKVVRTAGYALGGTALKAPQRLKPPHRVEAHVVAERTIRAAPLPG